MIKQEGRMKGKDPKAQNNPLPACNPDKGERRGQGAQLVLLLLTPGMQKQEGWWNTHKTLLSNPCLRLQLWSSCALLHLNQRARHKQLQTKRCWWLRTDTQFTQEKLLWFHHHAAGMMSSSRGQNSPPCTNTHLWTAEIKTKSSSSCLKSCQAYQVLLLPSWLSRKLT